MKLSEKRLLAPVLDRLIDTSDIADNAQPHKLLRQIRESVRRDLEHLLNTRYKCLSHPEGLTHLDTAITEFGLPDLSTVNLTASTSRERFCRDIEDCILTFEPRIKTVKVISEGKPDPEDPVIRFRVEAVLHINPAAEVIIFDSSLNPVTQNVSVSEVGA
ncbi:type VI secretion system baseplate subunit TssE [Marinibactrum halimedae]|uniref:IraD/Gp25-like domain-containing protein n=1 Tax=Marinibactrum halimedae TaxID=1444977 RepID=A0AA37WLJ5_9GAMM|nr:type VI secretion system baseplate subunit TssE [Marinibactrum halimedae]MCD9458362.1 type VI secretion system baseplate subunit TssE [Marinibactrum halimedae]GLS26059.1 hypothetical protein GCM10007877_17740 [Marinibactrum halimedae]